MDVGMNDALGITFLVLSWLACVALLMFIIVCCGWVWMWATFAAEQRHQRQLELIDKAIELERARNGRPDIDAGNGHVDQPAADGCGADRHAALAGDHRPAALSGQAAGTHAGADDAGRECVTANGG